MLLPFIGILDLVDGVRVYRFTPSGCSGRCVLQHVAFVNVEECFIIVYRHYHFYETQTYISLATWPLTQPTNAVAEEGTDPLGLWLVLECSDRTTGQPHIGTICE